MAAIIIPAHNEATVIARTLEELLLQLDEADEVVVICNGCSDGTAAKARVFEPRIRVLETSVPSKTKALNMGEQIVRSYPRIYMDADISLGAGAIARIKDALGKGPLLAASPFPEMKLTGASWPVKAYYDVWLSLPYCRRGMIGAGIYALSEAGRRRFEDFPDVIADDGYVRALFFEQERGVVDGANSIVYAPKSLSWLIKIKVRSRLGALELVSKFPLLRANEEKDYGRALLGVLRQPRNWPKALVYLYVNLVSKYFAQRWFGQLSQYQWDRDLSSRRN